MSWLARSVTPRNKRTGKALALSTQRRRLTKLLHNMGYLIKRTGDKHKIVAVLKGE